MLQRSKVLKAASEGHGGGVADLVHPANAKGLE